jgi:hypothetical protein
MEEEGNNQFKQVAMVNNKDHRFSKGVGRKKKN